MEDIKIWFAKTITTVFKPLLSWFFTPINEFLVSVYTPWASICALSLFFGGMIFVFSLRKEYVNLDAPGKGIFYDLRLWTVISMTPHVLVYLYFAKWS